MWLLAEKEKQVRAAHNAQGKLTATARGARVKQTRQSKCSAVGAIGKGPGRTAIFLQWGIWPVLFHSPKLDTNYIHSQIVLKNHKYSHQNAYIDPNIL